MTETIWKNGQTQIVRFTALATDYTNFAGESTGDPLPGVILVYSENRSTGWADQVIASPVALWQAENVAVWEAEIPPAYITLASGNGTLQVSGTGMRMVTIPLMIGGGGTGNEKVLTDEDFTINTTAKTILFSDTTLRAGHVLKIRNVTKNAGVFDSSRNTGETFTATETPGLFDYSYRGDMSVDDTIQVFINKAP
jgi:hypothetical protein